MRAIVADSPGGPEMLRLAEVPDPIPDRGEVLLRVHATAVNRADVLQRQGLYPPPPGASEIIGLEASGTIVAVGDGVDAWREGDLVCALLAGGGYAELVAVPEGQLMPVPAGLDLLEAGAVPEVFLTAHDNLLTQARLQTGEALLVHGGASGVGTAAIQLARRHGARVFVTAGTEAKLQRCAELGAEAGINYRSEDFVARCQELTGGAGVDVILDVIGAAYLERNLAALAADGRLAIIGLQGGSRAEIDLNHLLRRRLTVGAASLRGRPAGQKAAIVHRFVDDAVGGFVDGTLRPVIDRVLPLADAAEAHRVMEASEHVGKIVLRVEAPA